MQAAPGTRHGFRWALLKKKSSPKDKFLLIFKERQTGRGKEKERDRNINMTEKWDRTHNLGLLPDGESSLQPFSVRVKIQATELTWPGLQLFFE